MPLAVATLAVAVVVSLLRGGSLRRLADSDLRWPWLLFLGVAIQVAVDLAAARGAIGGVPSYAGIAMSQAAVLIWVLANRRLPGMALIGLGLLMNVAVIGANGAMPVDTEAIRRLGVEDATVAPGKHEPMTPDTRLAWLADVIPVPPIRTIVSAGDVVLAVGVAALVHHLMMAPPRPGRPDRKDGTTSAGPSERQ